MLFTWSHKISIHANYASCTLKREPLTFQLNDLVTIKIVAVLKISWQIPTAVGVCLFVCFLFCSVQR